MHSVTCNCQKSGVATVGGQSFSHFRVRVDVKLGRDVLSLRTEICYILNRSNLAQLAKHAAQCTCRIRSTLSGAKQTS